MEITNQSSVKPPEGSPERNAMQLFTWKQLLSGSPGLERVWTLLRELSMFIGPEEHSGMPQLATVVWSQAAVVLWKKLKGIDWDTTELSLGLDAGVGAKSFSNVKGSSCHDGVHSLGIWIDALTSILRGTPENSWMMDLTFGVTWNPQEELLHNDFMFSSREVCYPYDKEVTNKWFTAVETRKEDDGKEVEYEIKALNNTNKKWDEVSKEEEYYHHLGSKPGYWYHGTSHEHAVTIIKDGIRLTRGQKNKDFSHENGFYMAPTFTCAKEWCIERQLRGAVIVFNVRMQLEDKKLQVLDLNGEKQVANWKAVVKYNRCGWSRCAPLSGELRQMFDKADYIIGPMHDGKGNKVRCPTGEEACKRWQPKMYNSRPNQLCIKTERLAKVFGSLEEKHIEAVIFYPE